MSNPSAVLHAPKDLRIENRPMPAPGADEVLVQVQATGICGSDVHYYEQGRIGNYSVDAPMVIGHESAGTIVGVGENVDSGRIGELVALEPGVPCRKCEQCRVGRYNLCPGINFFATPPVHGTISHFVTIDSQFAHSAPDSLSPEQAAMAEPVAVGVWAAVKSQISVNDRVLVTGAGPIGIFAAQVARAFGAAGVTASDINSFRLETANALGIETEHADSPGSAEFDVLLECSGASTALTNGMRRLRPAGRIVLVGMGIDTAPINVSLVQSKELTIYGSFRYANTFPTALALIADGSVQVSTVISHRFGLQNTEDALTLGRRDPSSLKAIVLPDL